MLNFLTSHMTSSTMAAFAISTPTSSLMPSSSSSKFCALSVSIPKNAIFQHIKCIPQLGLTPFSQWNGLKHLGFSVSHYSVKIERRGKCKGKGVYASLFGVGAPEVLVIGVVALLVFGPKGLAEVARNLGKTLRAFQPTIRELQEVSREFKSTLEREIGLDDIDTPAPKRPSPNTSKPTPEDTPEDSAANVEPSDTPSESGEPSKDDYLKVTADQLTGALARLQKEQDEAREREMKEKEERENEEMQKSEIQSESQTPSQDTPEAIDTPQETSSVTPPSQNPSDSNALKEASPVASTGSTPQTQTDA